MSVAENGGTWINWRATGAPGGDPVLFIMGLGGSARAWWRLLPHLEADHRLIVFDNRGTGDSDRVRGPLGMADLVGDALAVLDDAGVQRAHVVGVSMGGMVAQHLALEHRERVRSLVLGSTTAIGRTGEVPWRMLATGGLRPLVGPGRAFALVAPLLYAERTRAEHADRMRQDWELRVADATDSKTIWAQIAAIARHDVRERLGELAGVPALVLHGAEDALVPSARGIELARAIPDARLVLLPGCGHMLTTDDEAGSAAAIRAHLAGFAASTERAA